MLGKNTDIALLGLGRLAIGAALVAAPRTQIGTGWIGEDAKRPTAAAILRGLGARDIALAAGLLATHRRGGALKPWLIGAAFADATDLAATLAAGKAIPVQGRVAIAALAGFGAVQQVLLARSVES